MQRSLFLLGLSLLIALGAAWGVTVVGIDSLSWRMGLSLPAGLVIFWPIAQQIANSPLGSLEAKQECTLAFTLKFLGRAIAMVSGVSAVVAAIVAGGLAIASHHATSYAIAIFAAKALALALGCVALTVGCHYLFRFLVKKIAPFKIDILYLGWAGAAMLAVGSIVASKRWIGVLNAAQKSDRATVAAWIAVLGVSYAIVQILGATPREKKTTIPDASITGAIVLCVAGFFWVLGSACVPVAIGLLALLGALILDKENKNRKF